MVLTDQSRLSSLLVWPVIFGRICHVTTKSVHVQHYSEEAVIVTCSHVLLRTMYHYHTLSVAGELTDRLSGGRERQREGERVVGCISWCIVHG